MTTADPIDFAGLTQHWVGDWRDEEWHRRRVTGIGGSEIASVLGLSPWESAFSLWHRKAGQRAGTWPARDEADQSEQMIWGNLDEPTIATRYEAITPGIKLYEVPLYTADRAPWMIANPDRILVTEDGTREVLEIKTSRFDDHWRNGPPVWYRCQVQWYLHVLQLERARLICRFGGCELKEYVITYDAADAELMERAGAAFMESLAADEAPAIDDSSSTFETLRQLPDGQVDTEVEIEDAVVCQLLTGLQAAKDADRLVTGARSLILDAIGDGRRAFTLDAEGKKVTVATRTVRAGKTYSLITGRGIDALAGACDNDLEVSA